jgi:hypothetical protein
MPKKNVNESVEIRFSVTPEIMDSLSFLAKSGLYGKSHTDAAMRILDGISWIDLHAWQRTRKTQPPNLIVAIFSLEPPPCPTECSSSAS